VERSGTNSNGGLGINDNGGVEMCCPKCAGKKTKKLVTFITGELSGYVKRQCQKKRCGYIFYA